MRLAFIFAAAACGTAAPISGKVHSDTRVYITSNVADAYVYVDGRLIGSVRSLAAGIVLDPGMHRIELRHDNYFSRYAEVTPHKAQTQRLNLQMAEILP